MEDDVVLCRASVELPAEIGNELMYLPGGDHDITPFGGGIGKPISVQINAASAAELERERSLIHGRKAPYFDFNHQDGPASFWPTKFVWRDGPQAGVYAQGEWTSSGKEAVSGKTYRYFSPVFYVDNKQATPAKVVCREKAPPNMGGLTNDPAFHQILPLWAKNAGAQPSDQPKPKDETKMTAEEIAALQAKQTELETKVTELTEKLTAKRNDSNASEESISAVDAELLATQAQLEATTLRRQLADERAINTKRNRVDAKEAVKRAVLRGAIASKNLKMQQDLELKATDDPSFIKIIDDMQGNAGLLTTRITGSDFSAASAMRVAAEDPIRIFGEMARIISKTQRGPHDERKRGALELAAVFAAEFHGDNEKRLLAFPVMDLQTAIEATDVTDGSLGTLAGVLVTQRTLELLKFSFPSLTAFTTDFSDQPATYNQNVITRIITIPNVTSYNTTTGWAASTAATTDVPVTIDQHRGVTIEFNEQILASSIRRLFDEFAPASAYALGKDMVDDLYSNVTDANFTNNTVIATASFTKAIVASVGTQLDLRGVPYGAGMRTMLLYPTVFEKISGDTTILNLGAYQRQDLITQPSDGVTLNIPIDAFKIIKAPNLPTNNGNVTGFAASKSALCIVTRTPNDYTSVLPGASFGNVQMVTDPDIGITVMLTQFVDHKLGRATSRIALMYGTNAGQGNAGQLIKAAAGSGSAR